MKYDLVTDGEKIILRITVEDRHHPLFFYRSGEIYLHVSNVDNLREVTGYDLSIITDVDEEGRELDNV